LKKKIILSSLWICLLVYGIFFVSCDNPAEPPAGPPVDYPYIHYKMIYMGTKPGLTSSSSDEAFSDGLDEIWDSYKKNSLNKIAVDGVVYDFANFHSIKLDEIPGYIKDLFWEELNKQYRYGIGSCFEFIYVHIPYKKAIGFVYWRISIVSEKNSKGYPNKVWYSLNKGEVNPK
jgi:hypothetical protein